MPLLIARRPVFDSREQIFAFDLAVCGDADGTGIHRDVHPEQLLAEVFLGTGIATVAGAHPVFVTASRELVLSGTLDVLPSDRVILQVPASAASDAELAAACRSLVAQGYRLAVDADERTAVVPPLESAHVIKVDIMATPPDALVKLTARLSGLRARLLAANVQHRGDRERCESLGFDLFEGYRFSAPEVFSRREIGVEHLHAFRVLKLLRDPRAEDREIEALVQGDVGLAYKLLRMVNSAAIGGRNIWSIGHALRVLGRAQVAKWLGVLLVTDAGDAGVRAELTHLALVRARLCELVADLAGVPKAAGSMFLVGLVSVLDQLLEIPMSTLCDAMDLAPDLRSALLHRGDFFGAALRLVEAYVSGQWADVETVGASLGVAPGALQPLYLDALQWASSQRRSNDSPA
ncbi:MAG: EAL and HDOD domain-containing protein [Gemmatimonadaceae bacterium]